MLLYMWTKRHLISAAQITKQLIPPKCTIHKKKEKKKLLKNKCVEETHMGGITLNVQTPFFWLIIAKTV